MTGGEGTPENGKLQLSGRPCCFVPHFSSLQRLSIFSAALVPPKCGEGRDPSVRITGDGKRRADSPS